MPYKPFNFNLRTLQASWQFMQASRNFLPFAAVPETKVEVEVEPETKVEVEPEKVEPTGGKTRLVSLSNIGFADGKR